MPVGTDEPMKVIDFTAIVTAAWQGYDTTRSIESLIDVSVHVSTNHVFKLTLSDGEIVFAKLSYYGKYVYFQEDHTIINALARALPPPYEKFLARSLTKNGKVYLYRQVVSKIDVWVVFYNPVELGIKLPKQSGEASIVKLGQQLADFHLACASVRKSLPGSSKTLRSDIQLLRGYIRTTEGRYEFRGHIDDIEDHTTRFHEQCHRFNYDQFLQLPVFIDWNIGNFSVTDEGVFFSRWDYDWFRVSSRVLDFYFFSRVVSEAGDQTVFSYEVSTLMEERFLLFLKSYHHTYPLTIDEVHFIKEAYRFFILNYVIKDGRYFFHDYYANRLQREAFQHYLPNLDKDLNTELLVENLQIPSATR